MAAEEHVYFPVTGEEQGPSLIVRLFDFNGQVRAKACEQAAEDGGDRFAQEGDEPRKVLRQAREFAALRGYNLRVELDGVDWDPELGSLA